MTIICHIKPVSLETPLSPWTESEDCQDLPILDHDGQAPHTKGPGIASFPDSASNSAPKVGSLIDRLRRVLVPRELARALAGISKWSPGSKVASRQHRLLLPTSLLARIPLENAAALLLVHFGGDVALYAISKLPSRGRVKPIQDEVW